MAEAIVSAQPSAYAGATLAPNDVGFTNGAPFPYVGFDATHSLLVSARIQIAFAGVGEVAGGVIMQMSVDGGANYVDVDFLGSFGGQMIAPAGSNILEVSGMFLVPDPGASVDPMLFRLQITNNGASTVGIDPAATGPALFGFTLAKAA